MSAPEMCIDCTLGVYGGDCNACETVESEGPTFKTQRPGPRCPFVLLAAKERECEGLQNDSRRIDALEYVLRHGSVGNGIAIISGTTTPGEKYINIIALGHEDGSNLGNLLVLFCGDLREAIDDLSPALAEGEV